MNTFFVGVVTMLLVGALWDMAVRGWYHYKGLHIMTFQCTDEAHKALQGLECRVKSGTTAGVIRASLATFSTLVEVRERGGRIMLEDAEGQKQEFSLDNLLA